MSHQIDTVHWFTGLQHPRSVVANGGIYMWKDGRKNWDTITAVFDYGPLNDPATGFQVTFASRMHNGDENPTEIYYSNGGELNLNTNKVSPRRRAYANHGCANEYASQPAARNEFESSRKSSCFGQYRWRYAYFQPRSQLDGMCTQPQAAQCTGRSRLCSHSIAVIMTNAAAHTGAKVTFDEQTQEVMANGKPFRY